MHPLLVLIIVAFGGAVVGLILQGEPPEQRGHYLLPTAMGSRPRGALEWAMDPTPMRQVRHQRAALRAAVDQDS